MHHRIYCKNIETNRILPSAEIDFALNEREPEVLLVTRDFTQVRFESLLLKVTQERFELITERPDWRKDVGPILSSIFQPLNHTPVTLLGFNITVHRPVTSPEAVLSRWIPISALAEVVGEADAKEGLPRLTASVKAKWNEYRALLSIESSLKIPSGVVVTQNFEKTLQGGAKELSELAQRDWERILKRSDEVQVKLLETLP